MKREISREMRQFLAARALMLAINGETAKSERIRQFLLGNRKATANATGTDLKMEAVAA